MNNQIRPLILSAYTARSHEVWIDQLQSFYPESQVFRLEPRFFDWRVRGNPLSWHQELSEILRAQSFTHLIATSMCDVATLRGIHPALNQLPCIVYFHENQFAYPEGAKAPSLEVKMVSLYNALAGDHLIFNSAWNRDSFLKGVESMMSSFPDRKPPQELVGDLRAKSQILPIAIDDMAAQPPQFELSPLLKVAWNHRWEFDKGPEDLWEIIQGLGEGFEVHLFGERFRRKPEVFNSIVDHPQVVVHSELDRKAYLEKLGECDLVLSTSKHEFQGLAILDGIQQGLLPVVPDGLSYVEMYPPQYRCDGVPSLIQKLRDIQLNWSSCCTEFESVQAKVMSKFSSMKTQAAWDQLLGCANQPS